MKMKEMDLVNIRPAKLEDLAAITKIYNEAIVKTIATFDTKTKTIEEQKIWFFEHSSRNPIFVAEIKGNIVGWAALSKWSDRCAYSDTAELSFYILQEYQGKGTGKKLFEKILQAGENAGLHTIISRITEGNESSLHLHKSEGFNYIGIMKEVGFKFGKRFDVHIMQKIFTKSIH
jgi:phosphinothricin acetyltransferase